MSRCRALSSRRRPVARPARPVEDQASLDLLMAGGGARKRSTSPALHTSQPLSADSRRRSIRSRNTKAPRVLVLASRVISSAPAFLVLAFLYGCGGSSSINVVQPSSRKCDIAVSNSMSRVPANGGKGNLTVETNRECSVVGSRRGAVDLRSAAPRARGPRPSLHGDAERQRHSPSERGRRWRAARRGDAGCGAVPVPGVRIEQRADAGGGQISVSVTRPEAARGPPEATRPGSPARRTPPVKAAARCCSTLRPMPARRGRAPLSLPARRLKLRRAASVSPRRSRRLLQRRPLCLRPRRHRRRHRHQRQHRHRPRRQPRRRACPFTGAHSRAGPGSPRRRRPGADTRSAARVQLWRVADTQIGRGSGESFTIRSRRRARATGRRAPAPTGSTSTAARAVRATGRLRSLSTATAVPHAPGS